MHGPGHACAAKAGVTGEANPGLAELSAQLSYAACVLLPLLLFARRSDGSAGVCPAVGELLLLLSRLEDLERAEKRLIHAHHSAGVVELATVVRRRKERDELPLGEKLIPVFDDLVRAADQIHVVLLQEARDDIRPERKTHAAVVLGPPCNILVRVAPQQVA